MNDKSDFIGGCLVVVAIIVVIFLGLSIRLSSTGQGNHTGYITAVEQHGYLFRNYIVYVKTDNSSSQEDTYCLDRSKTDLANKLKSFSKARDLVSVTFEGVRGIGLGLCSGEQITDVTIDQK